MQVQTERAPRGPSYLAGKSILSLLIFLQCRFQAGMFVVSAPPSCMTPTSVGVLGLRGVVQLAVQARGVAVGALLGKQPSKSYVGLWGV